jgi:hypothetical protein
MAARALTGSRPSWERTGSPGASRPRRPSWVDLRGRGACCARTGTLTNIALTAEARRRLDIYAGLSRGGSLDEIQFGAAGRFHRVWLEAAMGVAARSGDVEVRDTSFGFEAVFENTIVFSADYGGENGIAVLAKPGSEVRPRAATWP